MNTNQPNTANSFQFASAANCDHVNVYDCQGTPLELGAKEEKGVGGEGTVYEFPQNTQFLIKVYHDSVCQNSRKMADLSQRIMDMTVLWECFRQKDRNSSETIMDSFAWPIMPVMNARKEITGFVMRKCTGNAFTSLCGARLIKQRFRGWTRRQLAMTALDFVRKIRFLSKWNIYVNDFNPANFLVNQNSEVSFIDCASYQVPHGSHGVNITQTYFRSHVAPELLLDTSQLRSPRTIHQVEFGTGIIVFSLLMCGLHPYHYRDTVMAETVCTLEDNLIQGRCPLNGDSRNFPAGNWYNLWRCLPAKMQRLFIQMFIDGHDRPEARPSLGMMETSLKELLIEMDAVPELERLDPAGTSHGADGSRMAAC